MLMIIKKNKVPILSTNLSTAKLVDKASANFFNIENTKSLCDQN